MGTHPIFESDFDCLTGSFTFLDLSKMPTKLPSIKSKESVTKKTSEQSVTQPRTKRQPIIFSNPEKQRLYEFQREVLYLLNDEAAQREEEYQRRMVNNGGV